MSDERRAGIPSTARESISITMPGVPDPVRARRDSLAALDGFVTAKDLRVVFQPIVDLVTGAVFANEALVRCSVPAFANPLDLFEHAVAARCCGRLGRLIREIAIPLTAGTPVFVNIHPDELNDRWLVRPDEPAYFHDAEVYLELTESVPITHFNLCVQILKEMRSRGGMHLVVDDLGAGYSNLKRIADLSPSVVKLDRELIVGIERSDRQRRLVSGIVRLCVDLGARVVAEGIETLDEFNAVRDLGVHLGQGYLLARPAYPIPVHHWPPGAAEGAPPPDPGGSVRRRR